MNPDGLHQEKALASCVVISSGRGRKSAFLVQYYPSGENIGVVVTWWRAVPWEIQLRNVVPGRGLYQQAKQVATGGGGDSLSCDHLTSGTLLPPLCAWC